MADRGIELAPIWIEEENGAGSRAHRPIRHHNIGGQTRECAKLRDVKQKLFPGFE